MKNFEVLTYAIGSADTNLAGFLVTRLRQGVRKPEDPNAATPNSLPVESTIGFPDEGRIAVQGTLYRYLARSDDSFDQVAWFDGAVWRDGIRRTHQSFEDVWDQTNTRSLLDQVKRNIFVDTADGSYLNALARNLGIQRKPWVASDDLFRRIVQAIAFSPRGSLWTIEALLGAILGPRQNDEGEMRWNVWENLVLDQKGKTVDGGKVFIDLGPEFVSLDPNTSLGKTFIEERTRVRMRSTTELVLPFNPLDVTSVELAPDVHVSNCRVRPSDETRIEAEGETPTPVWRFEGDDEESSVQVINTGLDFRNATKALYVHDALIDSQTIASMRAIVTLEDNGAQNFREAVVELHDGQRCVRLGLSPGTGGYSVALLDDNDEPIGATFGPVANGRYLDLNIVHEPDSAIVYVDGRAVFNQPLSDLPPSTKRMCVFGFDNASGSSRLRVHKVQFFCESSTEFGENLSVSGADVQLAEPVEGFTNPVMSVRASRVYSAQLLEDSDVTNEVIDLGPPEVWRYYPFYLSNALNLVQEYIDDTVTAAGVHAYFRVQVPKRRLS